MLFEDLDGLVKLSMQGLKMEKLPSVISGLEIIKMIDLRDILNLNLIEVKKIISKLQTLECLKIYMK